MPESLLMSAAPAKINLSLEVLGRRPDGYHELDTIVQTLTLADRVIIVANGNHDGVAVAGPYASGTPVDRSNIAYQAAELLARSVGRSAERVLIRLDKHVPPAGGLGGGASDAATVLRLLGQHWEVPLEALFEVANAVGSDEAALLIGGTVRAKGRGERVQPLDSLPDHDVVLFIPPETIEKKTARMFQALAGLPFDDGAITSALASRSTIACVDVYNTFERVAFDLFPALSEHWQELEDATGEAIRLAGAGPTLFWIGPSGQGEAIAKRATESICTVIATSTARSLWRQ